MRKTDWLVAFLLMGMGILCMTVSAVSFLERPSEFFVSTLFTICLWLGIPLFVLGSVFYMLRRKNNRRIK